jgi:hypothetical protein
MKYIFTIILFSLFASCSTQREIFVDNPQILSFGSGGGFTNQTIEYKLHSDGKLWKYRGLENDSSWLKQLKKSQTKKIFRQAYHLGLDTLNLNSPGNMNHFIRLESKTLDNQVVWEKGSRQTQTEIIEFYKTLNQLTQSE